MRVGLATLLEQVQLAQAATVLPAWLDRAAHEGLGYADFLQGLREEALAARTAAATRHPLRDAAFPFAATSERFDFRSRPDRKPQVVLRSLDPPFVAQVGTPTLSGPPGRGKTMPAIGVATEQVQLGHTARFVTAQALAAQFGRTGTVVGPRRLVKPPLTCDVLVLDELGSLPTAPAFGRPSTRSSPGAMSAARRSAPRTSASPRGQASSRTSRSRRRWSTGCCTTARSSLCRAPRGGHAGRRWASHRHQRRRPEWQTFPSPPPPLVVHVQIAVYNPLAVMPHYTPAGVPLRSRAGPLAVMPHYTRRGCPPASGRPARCNAALHPAGVPSGLRSARSL